MSSIQIFKWVIVSCFIWLTLICYSQTNIEKIKFVSKTDTLVGFLNKPESVDNFSVVVVTHSASLGNHDSQIYNHLVQTLNRVGVGVFSGIGAFEITDLNYFPNPVPKKQNSLELILFSAENSIQLVFVSQGFKLGRRQVFECKKDCI